jgi:hypothetical protein
VSRSDLWPSPGLHNRRFVKTRMSDLLKGLDWPVFAIALKCFREKCVLLQ